MRGKALKGISTLKIKNTQLSDCRIVGKELWILEIQYFLHVYFSFKAWALIMLTAYPLDPSG